MSEFSARQFSKISRPESLPLAIAAQIQRLLEARKLRTGDRLPTERELSVQFGVGRSSVREAIQMLQMLGLVDVRRGIGMFLTREPGRWLMEPLKWTSASVAELFTSLIEARLCVEPEVARLAAERGTDEDIAAIQDAVEDCGAGTLSVPAGFRVHLAIADAAHSDVLAFMLRATSTIFTDVLEPLQDALSETEGREKLERFVSKHQDGHVELLEHISARRPADAADAMRAHLHDLHETFIGIARAADSTAIVTIMDQDGSAPSTNSREAT